MNTDDARAAIKGILEDAFKHPTILVSSNALNNVTDRIMEIIEKVREEDFINQTDVADDE